MDEISIENLTPISIEEAFEVFDEQPTGEPVVEEMTVEDAMVVISEG